MGKRTELDATSDARLPTDLSADEHRTIGRAANGDPEALRELHSRHAESLYEAAFRLTQSAPDARDVVQEVFVGLPEALSKYAGRGSFEGWLRKVAIRTALMKLRRRRHRREVPLGFLRARLPTRDVSDAVLDRLEVERALAELPADLRAVVVLKHVEGYSHREIGRLLGITEGASQVRLHRARKELRRSLRGA